MEAIRSALQSILQFSDLPAHIADTVHFTGADPVYHTQFRLAMGSAASIGAVGLMLAHLRETQTGVHSTIEIDARRSTASMRSTRYIMVDGKPGRTPRDNVTGFYRVAEGRWNYLHCNFPHHQAAALRVLAAPADAAGVAEAALRWNCFDLENAVDAAGGCAPAVRSLEEWRALPNTVALVKEPLLDIRKIGDSAPLALPGADRPLSGLHALDLTRVVAGPTCARMLAEYGTDVLKITCEKYPDSASNETDTAYGKRKAILDIATPEGRLQFETLLRDCDVLCQAYRPDAMAGLGFSRERAAQLRPGIIYTSLNAFGYTGPWRGRRGFDTVVQSASGMAVLQGTHEAPQFLPVSALDYLAGYLMTFGTLVALKRRAEVGGSYSVDVSLARAMEWLLGLGLVAQSEVKAAPEDLNEAELASMMVEVPSPLGKLKRFRPLIRFSDGAYSDLLPWRTFRVARATWGD